VTPSGADAPGAARPDPQALIRLLTEQAPAVLWTTDRELRFTSSMGAALRHLGLKTGQTVGDSLYDYFGTRSPDFPPIAHHLRALSGEKSTYGFDWGGRSFHTWVEPLISAAGEVIGTLGLAIDVTDRKRAEAALQDSQERWKAVVTQAPDFIFILDRDGRIFYINRMNEGFTPEDVIGRSTLDFVLPSYRAAVRAAYARAFETGQIVTYDVEAHVDKRRSKATAWFRNRVGPLHRNGKVANLILVSTDITESKAAETALKDSFGRMRLLTTRLQSAREEERKRIAQDIHDRLGQSLTGLKLDLSSLARRLGKDAEGRRQVKAIFRSLDETIRTVREISTGLRPAVLDSLGLRAAIEWQAREFQNRTGLSIRLDLPPRDVALDSDRSAAVFRIFQELLTNVARHARAKRVAVSLKAAGDRLALTVSDDGRGISAKALEDPASLGLLGMRERALDMDGAVDIRGRRGRGTTAVVAVPLKRRKR
jgi:PAS domain S-box-containing protein